MGKKSELDDLRARLESLEAEVSRLRGAAAATGTATGTAAVTVEDQPGQPQSMTRIADALGVMVSARTEERTGKRAEERTEERTQVLRTRPEPLAPPDPPKTLEPRNTPAPARSGGQFLESLLSGQPALQQ
ncbi:hypothetical protein ACIG0C_31575 [Kitasatospora aureofaciens]|uniref:Uncharacterized protein n=2 Tax=Kitasatospora aureofaciens TaxID=1894 RepID=A0A1E7N8P7_KITAU|nr:hypothetical protein [Kitasatospora aureofaciens]ARF81654.1 hypothetical protein B6264_24565 [Kitasatospora aureofaciens]OEV37075.1 hypothetical protein HS99_0004425 [Kitasatospora aureofaciens]GGV01364.1 hypothetical protein GCM10010502_64930 [Kitasatospora aureofaciens]